MLLSFCRKLLLWGGGHTALSATEKADQRKIGKIESQRNAKPNENPLLAFSVAAKLQLFGFQTRGKLLPPPEGQNGTLDQLADREE